MSFTTVNILSSRNAELVTAFPERDYEELERELESHPAKEKSPSASQPTKRNVNGLRDLHAAQADMDAVDRTQLALNDRLHQEVLVEARMYLCSTDISVGYDTYVCRSST